MKKRIIAGVLFLLMLFSITACGSEPVVEMKPEVTQMKAICELAVMECYYHSVAKYHEDDVSGFLWWKKDMDFWMEYTAVVTLGIDVEKLTLTIDGDEVTITLPEAKILNSYVDPESLNPASYIVDKDSADVTGEKEVLAEALAEDQLLESVSADTALMERARERAKLLLGEYIRNVGEAVGKNYTIHWIYLEDADVGSSEAATDTTAATEE